MCYSNPAYPGVLNVSTSATSQQRQGTEGFNLFMRLLPLLSPSPECVERVVPSLCLQVFRFCDDTESDNLTMTLRATCFEIRDNVCAREWSTAADLLRERELPTCEDLPDIVDECTGKMNYCN